MCDHTPQTPASDARDLAQTALNAVAGLLSLGIREAVCGAEAARKQIVEVTQCVRKQVSDTTAPVLDAAAPVLDGASLVAKVGTRVAASAGAVLLIGAALAFARAAGAAAELAEAIDRSKAAPDAADKAPGADVEYEPNEQE